MDQKIEDEIVMPCNSSVVMEMTDTCLPVMMPVQMQDYATLVSHRLTYPNPDCLPNYKSLWKTKRGRILDHKSDCYNVTSCESKRESDDSDGKDHKRDCSSDIPCVSERVPDGM